MNQILMTLNGMKELQKKLKYLIEVKRPKIIKEIRNARMYGDLKENAEYHAAKEEQNFYENKIQEIKIKLSKARVIDITKITPNNKVVFGATVKIKNLNNQKQFTYKIVGEDESDFKKGFISIGTPIARGLIGKKKNDVVSIKTPKTRILLKIISIQHI